MMLDGPYADDLILGRALPLAPSITLDAGLASHYQAITGDSLRLALSVTDSQAVTGESERLVNPGLVLQIAIGQSTVATRRVIANLFYRDVALQRQVHIGDTLTTTVTPTALELTRPGVRERRAKVLLKIETFDQAGRLVARFERLALLPCRDSSSVHEQGDIGGPNLERPLNEYLDYVPAQWDLERAPDAQDTFSGWLTDPLSDTVTSAVELVRLTQNQAAAHRDPARGQRGHRLVYGGHAIGLAQASLSRMVPGLITVLGWRGCDHLGPVFEGDILDFRLEQSDQLDRDGYSLAGFRVIASSRPQPPPDVADTERPGTHVTGAPGTDVLDWRPVVLLARSHHGTNQQHATVGESA